MKIAWLYYDLLELYGDRGNIKILENVLIENGIDVEIHKITLHDKTDISDFDIVFLGGGSDYAQSLLYEDLISRKQHLINVMNNHGFILTICGGYQMFGQYYKTSSGQIIDGLKIFDYYTEAGSNRCTGNVICEFDGIKIAGFENHGGQTYNVANPFAKVLKGHGNSYQSEFEGCLEENFLGTYVHGPLLPKNPEIAKYIIQKVLKEKYNKVVDIDISFMKYAKKAKDVVVEREL